MSGALRVVEPAIVAAAKSETPPIAAPDLASLPADIVADMAAQLPDDGPTPEEIARVKKFLGIDEMERRIDALNQRFCGGKL